MGHVRLIWRVRGWRGGRTSAIARIFHTGLCSCSYQGLVKTNSFSENSAYVLNERAQTKIIYALRNNLVKLNYTLSMALSRQLQSSLHGISALITITCSHRVDFHAAQVKRVPLNKFEFWKKLPLISWGRSPFSFYPSWKLIKK